MNVHAMNVISESAEWFEHGKSIAAADQTRHAQDIKKAHSIMKKNQSLTPSF